MSMWDEVKKLAGINEGKTPFDRSALTEFMHLANSHYERMSVLLFRNGKPMAFNRVDLATGDENRVQYDGRDIVKAAQKKKADQVYLIHNHPDAVSAIPSDMDLTAARDADEYLRDYGITARHFVVASGKVVDSFNDLVWVEFNGLGIIR